MMRTRTKKMETRVRTTQRRQRSRLPRNLSQLNVRDPSMIVRLSANIL